VKHSYIDGVPDPHADGVTDTAGASPSYSVDGHWRIELLGGIRAKSGRRVVTRFAGRAVVALLARLALQPKRSHSREELIELFWPGVAVDVGRNRLRQVLSTLRNLLEPPGSGAGLLLIADRSTVRINEHSVACDALEFELAMRAGRDRQAHELYQGELLPGLHDEWIVDERRRLLALHEQLVERGASSGSAGELEGGSGDELASARAETRVPAYLDSFVGREWELQRCAEAVTAHRLVTVVGIGGCGKTRLAAEVARTIGAFEPVIFVALADCREGAQLADRVRIAARFPASGTPLEMLAAHIGGRRALMVLDNFEQLAAEGGAEALEALLAAVPGVHALVTSRRVLRVAGEFEMQLLPLLLPELDDDLPAASRNPAVALFVDRARNVRGDFRLTSGNRDDLLRICRTLEGLPLALELAASRVRTYSLRAMRGALSDRFVLLTRNARQAAREPRHGSLLAALEWSWNLLTPGLRSAMGRLAVFRDGFSATDARAVTGEADAHGLLDELVSDSLLQAREGAADEAGGRDLRFGMLEAMREFVIERIGADEAAVARRAHRAHFLGSAMAMAARHQPVAEEAIGNFVEALRTAIEDEEHALALALALALKIQWESVATPPEALALMARAARSVPEATDRFVPFLGMFARLLLLAGQREEALTCARRALVVAGDDIVAKAEALFAHTRIDWVVNRDALRVIAAARDGLRFAEQAGLPELQASATSLLGAVTLWGLNDATKAERLYRRAEALYVELGDARGALQATHGVVGCHYCTRQYESAIRLAHELLAQSAALGNVEAEIVALNLLTASQAKLHLFDQALATSRREARLAYRHHKAYNVVHALWNQGYYLARLRRPEEAAALLAFSARYWVDNLGELPPIEQRELEKVRRLVTRQIGAIAYEAGWNAGTALSVRDGIRLGCGD
jgi:predicted ATPase